MSADPLTSDDTSRIELTAAGSSSQRAASPYRPDAPNVVVIVLDDVGFAQLGCYGSDIATPAIDELAAGGVRLTNFHTTAVCSPTRACLLTGRNHHRVGMGMLPDLPMNFPGYTARIPDEAGTLAQILRDEGYATFAVGKWHLTPRDERSPSGPFENWPLGKGFEHYYGFLERRRQPLGAGADPRQHLRRPATFPRRGLPPDRGPGRRDHRPCAGAAPQPAGATLPGLARTRGRPRPAPRRRGVERRLRRAVRRGLGRVAPGDTRPPDRAGHRGARHRAAHAIGTRTRLGRSRARSTGACTPA